MGTNFPSGVSSYGVPLLAGPGLVPSVPPGLSNGVYFVDGTNGADSNDGFTPLTALKSLDVAFGKCYGGYNEIIYALGSASSINFSSAITSGSTGLAWNKDYVHLIGLGTPSAIGQRAHISNGASTKLYTPLITVSGNGCTFQNVEFFNGGNHATQAAVCLLVTGDRTTFINCQISGGGHATAAGNAAMRSLVIGSATGPIAADECFFLHCYIGLDTIARTAATSEIEVLGGSARVKFEDCDFSCYATGSGSGAFFFKVGADGIDRFLELTRCRFLNASTFSGGVDLGNAMSLNAACGGRIVMNSCALTGVTATAATKTCLFFDNVNGSTTTGLDIVAGW